LHHEGHEEREEIGVFDMSLAVHIRPRLGDRRGFKNRVGLDVTDEYASPSA